MSQLTRRRGGPNSELNSPTGEDDGSDQGTNGVDTSKKNKKYDELEAKCKDCFRAKQKLNNFLTVADADGFTPDEIEGKKVKLTLMDEVLLLALRDEQGYYSWWNDSLSYVLRGCILMELAMRNRIVCFKEAGGKHHRKPFAERLVDLVDDSPTGEVLLDETLKLMKSEQFGVDSTGKATGNRHTIIDWIDLLSGETWNILRSSLQLKLVRERLSKGLVDKGVLRTEKKNFLVFEMTTHPVADPAVKSEIVNRVVDLLLNRGPKPTRRTIALACAVGAASLLENALSHFTAHTGTSLSYSQKDACFARYEELLVEYSGTQAMERSNAAGGSADMLFKDMQDKGRMGWSEIMFGVVNVFIKMDSVLI